MVTGKWKASSNLGEGYVFISEGHRMETCFESSMKWIEKNSQNYHDNSLFKITEDHSSATCRYLTALPLEWHKVEFKMIANTHSYVN